MKILGINFGRSKKIRPKKQNSEGITNIPMNFTIPHLDSSMKSDTINIEKYEVPEYQEIELPEKLEVNLDDDKQIGFIAADDLNTNLFPDEDKKLINDSNTDITDFKEHADSSEFDDYELESSLSNLENQGENISLLNLEEEECKSENFRDENVSDKKDFDTFADKANLESEFLDIKIEEKKHLLDKLDNEIKLKETELNNLISLKTSELEKINGDILEKKELLNKIELNKSELNLSPKDQLTEEINKLENIIVQKKEEINKLDGQLKILYENFSLKTLDIKNLEQQYSEKLKIIEESQKEINQLEIRMIEFHKESKDLLMTKNEIYNEILKLQDELKELKLEKEKTIELIQISQKRREEIEYSNDQLEKRLLRMIQKFDDEIKELSNHKANIEKKIAELENKVIENENIIFEKQNKLNETEDKLRLRQIELISMNNLISSLNEKEDYLSNTLSEYKKEIASKKSDNQLLRNDIDALIQKKTAIEKMLEELFSSSEKRISNLRETFFKTENEIRNKEFLSEELNQKIDKTIDELVEIQKSIQLQKNELEELKIKSETLKKINESLEKEIDNKNKILDQFNKMKDDISNQPIELRKDFTKEFGINKDIIDPNEKRIFRL